MTRVTGIGGIFFKARDPVALRDWYRKHLGIDVQEWGGAAFPWADGSGRLTTATTLWSVSGSDSDYFAPSTAPFMIKLPGCRPAGTAAGLRSEGCNVLEKADDSEDGKFGWVMDPEGNKVELWQSPEGQ
jgi:hypothetical protein